MIELYYPLKPIHVNQPFGANYNAFYKQAGYLGHGGIDFQAVHGQKIYATHDGTCFPMVDSHGGNGVVLSGGDLQTIYWHLIKDDAVVHTGTKVKAGDLLGYADNTGESTGDHLHFGLTIIGTSIANGYGGYIDPQPYFNGKYAEDIQNPPTPPQPYVFHAFLKLKAWSMDVKQLQLTLQKLNLYTGAIDGIFGPITESAVKNFQGVHGLVVDGIVGPLTNAELNK